MLAESRSSFPLLSCRFVCFSFCSSVKRAILIVRHKLEVNWDNSVLQRGHSDFWFESCKYSGATVSIECTLVLNVCSSFLTIQILHYLQMLKRQFLFSFKYHKHDRTAVKHKEKQPRFVMYLAYKIWSIFVRFFVCLFVVCFSVCLIIWEKPKHSTTEGNPHVLIFMEVWSTLHETRIQTTLYEFPYQSSDLTSKCYPFSG